MAPVRLGVVGCGAIAQIQHLPNLAALQEEFSVEMVCDRSPWLARQVAAQFQVARHTSDYRRLLEADVQAVLLCHTDPKTEVAIAAFAAGKHVFIEKPVCFSLEEADALLEAARASGRVGLAGYMKVYDPAFAVVRSEVEQMSAIRFAQINHLHTDNSHHLAQFRLKRAPDLGPQVLQATARAREQAVRQAIGEVPAEVQGAFGHLSGSMIHDLYGLRALMGVPAEVVSTEIWNQGWGIAALFAYESGARCAATWVELSQVRDFKETLEIFGDDRRITLSYPTGFARGILSTVTIQGLDQEGNPVCRQPAIPWESPFVRELRHFHECITTGAAPQTSLEEARQDIKLIIDIIRAYVDRRPGTGSEEGN
jgi:predicted dehydrogenase